MIGERVGFSGRVIPLYPELIKLHNNIMIASNVRFVTHDAINFVLNGLNDGCFYPETIGCIEIMDNVFIGTGTTILYGVKIHENVIVGAGSLVNKDLEPNSVYAGVPAKKIGTFCDYVSKRRESNHSIIAHNQHLSDQEIAVAWNDFEKTRMKTK